MEFCQILIKINKFDLLKLCYFHLEIQKRMQCRNQQEYKCNERFYLSFQRKSKKRLWEKERSRICFESNVVGTGNHEGRSGTSEEVLESWKLYEWNCVLYSWIKLYSWMKVNRERIKSNFKLLYSSKWSCHNPNWTYFRCPTKRYDHGKRTHFFSKWVLGTK